MNDDTRMQFYVDEERDARLRLARYKAKLYARPQYATEAGRRRLGELQRKWEFALGRLREAKARSRSDREHHVSHP
jgi:hypothetical protein